MTALAQGSASFENFVQQNVNEGRASVESLLGTGTTSSDHLADVQALVSSIDTDTTLDEGAKLAQAYGMLEAVASNETLSTSEKTTLSTAITAGFDSLNSESKSYLDAAAASLSKQKA